MTSLLSRKREEERGALQDGVTNHAVIFGGRFVFVHRSVELGKCMESVRKGQNCGVKNMGGSD